MTNDVFLWIVPVVLLLLRLGYVSVERDMRRIDRRARDLMKRMDES